MEISKVKHIFTNAEELELGQIYCIGRNYSAHAREMGSVVESDPIVFLKPNTSYFNTNYTFEIPEFSDNIHHEVELVLVIAKDCYKFEREDVSEFITGYGIGIDFTARDAQQKAKEKGHPWAVAKGFYRSAPVSKIIPANEIKENYFDIELYKNANLVQSVNTKEMEHNISKIIKYLSSIFYLQRGDCIFTGTPSGVGRVEKGNKLRAVLNKKLSFELNVV